MNRLVLAGDTWVHRCPAQVKVVAALGFVAAVVATPRHDVAAFGLHLAVVAVVVLLARLPLGRVVRRVAWEVPFLVFAAALPFLGRGERYELAGLSLSVEGSWAAWNIVAKATLGTLAAVVLSSTTDVPALLGGLRRLRVPEPLVGIALFMVRYLEVLTAQLERLHVARIARGDDPRWLWQARAVASTAGTVFVRSYERGERVYLAMQSRGFTGTLPPGLADRPATAGWWVGGCVPAVVAATVAVVAHLGP